jgi:enterochelin esterase-like enzyme
MVNFRWLSLAVYLAGLLLGGCGASAPLRLNYDSLQSPGMGQAMRYAVYVPKGWTAAEQLPLVMFLHGSGDGPDSFDRADLGSRLDQGTTPRAVIVIPQGDMGFWENWASGDHPYRDWVMRELLPFVQRRYNTKPCPEGCHVMGISMGGHGALMFALHEPGSFSSVSAISPPIYTAESVKAFYDNLLWHFLLPIEDMWGPYDAKRVAERSVYNRWRSPADLNGIRLLIAWGKEEDPEFVRDCTQFNHYLNERQIPHTALNFPGGHEWKAWVPVVLEALRRQLPSPTETVSTP